MRNFVSQRFLPRATLWVVLLVAAAAGFCGCGGSASASGPTPTPTPIPAPTPTPSQLPAGAIGLKVLNTSVPPGGIFQFQLSNTEPKPIGHGSTRPQVPAGPVRGVAVNDPSGVAAGIAVIDTSVTPTNIKLQLSSPDNLLGTNVSYPVVTMSMPLSSTLTPGVTFPISIDTANTSFFSDASTKYTTLEFAPGTLTIAPAGSPYVSDLSPAGGLLPDRQLIKVFGANFNTNTRVAIEGTTIVPADITLVNSGEIDVKICNGAVADGATVCPGTGATFQLDGERVRVKDTNTNFTLDYYTYLRADDVAGSSANAQVNLVHPMFSRQKYAAATVPLVNTASQFTGVSLQNTSGTDAGIEVRLLDNSNVTVAGPVNFTLPTGKKITRDVVADWFGGSVPAGAVKVKDSSGPVSVHMLGMLGDTSAGTIVPVIPQ